MRRADQYRVNSPNVIHEIIDGEAVIVNLDKGLYYSLLNTGAEIWECINEGMPKADIVSYLLTQYDSSQKEIENAVDNVISKLQTEEIIVLNLVKENTYKKIEEKIESKIKKEFKIPHLEKFTDMEELLLLDPIHEVDEMGWPNMAPPISKEGK